MQTKYGTLIFIAEFVVETFIEKAVEDLALIANENQSTTPTTYSSKEALRVELLGPGYYG